MEIWQILLITIVSAIVLGILVGMLVGKHQLKKTSGNYKPLLTIKERIVYLSCFALGAVFVLLGVFQPFPSQQEQNPGELPPEFWEEKVSDAIDSPADDLIAPMEAPG